MYNINMFVTNIKYINYFYYQSVTVLKLCIQFLLENSFMKERNPIYSRGYIVTDLFQNQDELS